MYFHSSKPSKNNRKKLYQVGLVCVSAVNYGTVNCDNILSPIDAVKQFKTRHSDKLQQIRSTAWVELLGKILEGALKKKTKLNHLNQTF